MELITAKLSVSDYSDYYNLCMYSIVSISLIKNNNNAIRIFDDVALELESCTKECMRIVLGYTKYVHVGHHFYYIIKGQKTIIALLL